MTGRNNLPGFGSPMSGGAGISYVPTVAQTGNTFTTQTGASLRVGPLLFVWGTFTAVSTVAATTLTISLPAGIAAGNLPGLNSGYGAGAVGSSTVATQQASIYLQSGATTTLITWIATTASGSFYFHAIVPVTGA